MIAQRLPREEKEALYIRKMTELQTRWQNPIDGDWQFVKDMTDEQLDTSLNDTLGQLRFEKVTGGFGKTVKFAIAVFVTLGVLGLLLFGIRQIF